jgi:hypothetical protein
MNLKGVANLNSRALCDPTFLDNLYILFNERIMMAITTREDDFVSRAAGECRNSP